MQAKTIILRCPERICYATWPLAGDKKDITHVLEARAKHGRHTWPLYMAVTKVDFRNPASPLSRIVGRWLSRQSLASAA